MIAFLAAILWGLASGAQLLPDGLLRGAGGGVTGSLDVGLAKWDGAELPLNEVGIRGGFAYSPGIIAGMSLDVDASQSTDSVVHSRSRLALFLVHPFVDPSGPFPEVALSLAWWTHQAHFDKRPTALDQSMSGGELSLSVGVGGLAAGPFQFAAGVFGGGQLPVTGVPQGANGFVGGEFSAMLDMKGFWPGARELCRGLGVYLRSPFQWNFSPQDPASGTGRPSLGAKWTLGGQLGLTGSM